MRSILIFCSASLLAASGCSASTVGSSDPTTPSTELPVSAVIDGHGDFEGTGSLIVQNGVDQPKLQILFNGRGRAGDTWALNVGFLLSVDEARELFAGGSVRPAGVLLPVPVADSEEFKEVSTIIGEVRAGGALLLTVETTDGTHAVFSGAFAVSCLAPPENGSAWALEDPLFQSPFCSGVRADMNLPPELIGADAPAR